MSVVDDATCFSEGACCQDCGVWFDDVMEGEEPPGRPRSCDDCESETKEGSDER
jgi:hypothetical protein